MQKKRGNFPIDYECEDVLLYEFKQYFYIIQRGQQGITLAPRHGSMQRGTESVKLYAKIRIGCTEEELGSAILGAMDAYDTVGPDFESWEREKLRRNMKIWLEARGQKDIDVNSRCVQILRRLNRGGEYEIVPYDNKNLNPWYGPYDGKEIFLPFGATASEIGTAVRQALTIATHHPQYEGKH